MTTYNYHNNALLLWMWILISSCLFFPCFRDESHLPHAIHGTNGNRRFTWNLRTTGLVEDQTTGAVPDGLGPVAMRDIDEASLDQLSELHSGRISGAVLVRTQELDGGMGYATRMYCPATRRAR